MMQSLGQHPSECSCSFPSVDRRRGAHRAACSRQQQPLQQHAAAHLAEGCSPQSRRQARRQQRRRADRVVPHAAPAAAPEATAAQAPALKELELSAVVNVQGFILPKIPEGTEATVFAMYDQSKQLQYVGFSKDYRNTLRTLLGRRPDRAFFHRAHHMPELDQAEMLSVREQWFQEQGSTPVGNRLPTERDNWQKPLAAIAISQRGRLQAAQTLAQEQLLLLKGRGVREEMLLNQALLQQGQVDFLPSKAMTAEEIAEQQSMFESISKATRSVKLERFGEEVDMQIFFSGAYRTNGGHMFDVNVTYDDKETQHRIIVGRDYYEFAGLEPEEVVERVLAFLTAKNVPRHTEGVLLSSQFPINYFSVTTVEQWFGDDFIEELKTDPSRFWRFNKVHSYSGRFDDRDEQVLNLDSGNAVARHRADQERADQGLLVLAEEA